MLCRLPRRRREGAHETGKRHDGRLEVAWGWAMVDLTGIDLARADGLGAHEEADVDRYVGVFEEFLGAVG